MSSVKEFIQKNYDAEHRPGAFETSSFTIRISNAHLCMLQAIVDRFGNFSRAGLGVQLMESAIFDAFDSLRPDDRITAARKADEALKEAGFSAYWKFVLESEALEFMRAEEKAKQREAYEALAEAQKAEQREAYEALAEAQKAEFEEQMKVAERAAGVE